MLATGSADTTVRVWDVGEEFLPHANEWTRAKSRLLYHPPESKPSGGKVAATSGISALEKTVIGESRDEKPHVEEGGRQGSAVAQQLGSGSHDKTRAVVRSIRPDLLRQAGARAVWRTGRVTALLDRTRLGLKLPPATGVIATGVKKSRDQPLIEVRNGV